MDECFAELFRGPADDARCRKFADYVVDNFVAADSDFPPTLWAHAPDVMPVTTNGAESYHGHLNVEFNAPHPNICIFSFASFATLRHCQFTVKVAYNSKIDT